MTTIQALTGVSPNKLLDDSQGEVIWCDLVSPSDELAAFLSKMVRYHFYQRYKDAKEALLELNRVFPVENSASMPPLASSISTVIPPSNPSPGSSTIITPSNLSPGSSTIIASSVPDIALEPKKIGKKCGYVDEDGKVVISPQFDHACSFSEGLAEVVINFKWVYIDKTGNCID